MSTFYLSPADFGDHPLSVTILVATRGNCRLASYYLQLVTTSLRTMSLQGDADPHRALLSQVAEP